jgi:hypothetical protein
MDDDAVLRAIDEELSKGNYPIVDLTDELLSGHAVLAYGIKGEIDEDDIIKVAVYDSNDPNHPEFDDPWYDPSDPVSAAVFVRQGSDDKYSFSSYSDYDKSVFMTAGAPGSGSSVSPGRFFTGGEEMYNTLVLEALGNYLSVGILESGGTESAETLSSSSTEQSTDPEIDLSVRAVNNQQGEFNRVQSAEIREVTGYEVVYFQFGAAAHEYEIDLSGADTDEYDLHIEGSVAGGGTIDETLPVSEVTQKSQTLSVEIPETEEEEGTVSPIPDDSSDDGGGSGDDGDSSDDGGPSDSGDTSDDGTDSDSSGDGGLGTTEIAAVGGGGALALLSGAYALMRWSGDNDGTKSNQTPETPSQQTGGTRQGKSSRSTDGPRQGQPSQRTGGTGQGQPARRTGGLRQDQSSQRTGGAGQGQPSRGTGGTGQGQPSQGSDDRATKRSTQFCPNCGETLSIGARRCTNCGSDLNPTGT